MTESRVFLFSSTTAERPPATCAMCGAAMVEAPQPNGLYRYTACGLDDVLVDVAGATEYDCTACDEGGVVIRAIADLHRVIAQDRLRITLLRPMREDERVFLQNYVLCAIDPEDEEVAQRIADGGFALRFEVARVLLAEALHNAADDMERQRKHRKAQRAGKEPPPLEQTRWRAAGGLHGYLAERAASHG